jgi:hypothetical protein
VYLLCVNSSARPLCKQKRVVAVVVYVSVHTQQRVVRKREPTLGVVVYVYTTAGSAQARANTTKQAIELE